MKKKILLVEDDKILQIALITGFQSANYEVYLASDGQEGIKIARAINCDIILLDIILPLLDGFQVLSTLRKSRKKNLKNVPIIILTNLAQAEDAKKGLEKGADDYLVKTDLSINQIVERIEKYLV